MDAEVGEESFSQHQADLDGPTDLGELLPL